jgi:hypothetical protein
VKTLSANENAADAALAFGEREGIFRDELGKIRLLVGSATTSAYRR